MNPRSNPDEAAGHKPLPPIVLDGYRLRFAQTACVALTALSVGLFLASIFPAYEQLSTVCESNAGCVHPRLFPEDAKDLEGLGLSVGSYAAYLLALALALALGFWVIGAILFRKSSRQLMALYASITLVTYGTVQADTIHWLADAHPRLDLLVDFVYFVGPASFFVLFCMFPDGRLKPRWTRWVAVASITYWLLGSFFPDSSPISPRSWPLVIDASLFLGLIGSLVVAQIHRYRRVSGPVEHQQTKWVVWGFTVYIAMLVVVLLSNWIFALTRPGIPQVFYDLVSAPVIILSTLLIPLSIGFAVQRHHLWDIDRIIELSLVYTLLTGALAIVFELANQLLLPSIFQFIPALDDSPSIKTGVSVVIALAVLKPSHAWIKKGVSKLFGDQRVDGQRDLAEQRAQDEALRDYLSQMSSLLLDRDLRGSKEDSEVRTLARAQTLTVLGSLDPSRKTAVMKFLVEAKLVQRVDGRGPIIRLDGADLRGANMNDANLSGAVLFDANLSEVHLSNANLSGADLHGAHLRGADLRNAILKDQSYPSMADLSGADLSGADLSGAYVRARDKKSERLVTNEMLDRQAESLQGTTMPNGQKYEEWLKDKDHRRDVGGKRDPA
jgi:uncharacterized protein YjbI with pentapeptide repeats